FLSRRATSVCCTGTTSARHEAEPQRTLEVVLFEPDPYARTLGRRRIAWSAHQRPCPDLAGTQHFGHLQFQTQFALGIMRIDHFRVMKAVHVEAPFLGLLNGGQRIALCGKNVRAVCSVPVECAVRKFTARLLRTRLLRANANYVSFAKSVRITTRYRVTRSVSASSSGSRLCGSDDPLAFDVAVPVLDLYATGPDRFGKAARKRQCTVAVLETMRICATRRKHFPAEQGGGVNDNQNGVFHARFVSAANRTGMERKPRLRERRDRRSTPTRSAIRNSPAITMT